MKTQFFFVKSKKQSIRSSTKYANSNVWASKTDRCSFVLIFLIIYSTVVSTFDLTARGILQCNFNFYVFISNSAFLSSTSSLNCFVAIFSWLWSWASQKMRENPPLEDFAGANLSSFFFFSWCQQQICRTTQICCILLTFILSILVSHFIEKPIYKLSSALLFQSLPEHKV